MVADITRNPNAGNKTELDRFGAEQTRLSMRRCRESQEYPEYSEGALIIRNSLEYCISDLNN